MRYTSFKLQFQGNFNAITLTVGVEVIERILSKVNDSFCFKVIVCIVFLCGLKNEVK